MPTLIDVIGAEKYEQFKQWWDDDDVSPTDQNLIVGQAFMIAQDSFNYDMSVCCGKEQEHIGNVFYEAFQAAQGEVTDAVRLAVGRALVTVLAMPHCQDYHNCNGSDYEPEA